MDVKELRYETFIKNRIPLCEYKNLKKIITNNYKIKHLVISHPTLETLDCSYADIETFIYAVLLIIYQD